MFLLLKECGADRFFIIKEADFNKLLGNHYRTNLEKHEGVRPKKHDSYHAGIRPEQLAQYENNWELFDDD